MASNIENVLRQGSVLAILSMGVAIVLLTGELDLSTGAIVAASGTVAAMAYERVGNIMVAALAAVAVGLLVGAINGMLVVRVHISSFIATLGMLAVVRGAIMQVTGGAPISALPPGFEILGTGSLGFLPFPVVLVSVIFMFCWVLLRFTRLGRRFRAVGGSPRAAYLAGISVRRTRWAAFVISGALAGIAGLLLASRVHSGQPTAALGIELQAVAAAVLGGVSLYGGRGSVEGALAGVLFMSFLTNGLNLVGVSTYIQGMVIGAALIGAVWADVALTRPAFGLRVRARMGADTT
jgi:ribose/xylose/arabinose/galactoside ABC-type transport system permease subunit